MQRATIFYTAKITVKPIVLFTAALYLFGFSLNGVNVNGAIDALIPFERALCFAVSISFFLWFLNSVLEIVRLVQKQKP